MKRLLLLVLLGMTFNNMFAHCPYCSMATLNADYGYDFKNKTSSIGGNLNAYYLYINGGIDYKYMTKTTTDLKRSEISGYLGVGYISVFQLQYGYSTNKLNSLRLRSEIPLEFLFPKKDMGFLGLITFSMSFEHYLNTSKKSEYISLGIGIPIIDFISGSTVIY